MCGLALLAGLVSTNHAFTLGDLRGSVVIGRPLDVSVTIQAAADEEVSAPCFKAEVFHAETPQVNPTVSVTPLTSTTTPSYRVRVQSAAPVDEPVVTVLLRSTCATALTRRYVVLADFPVVVLPEPATAQTQLAAAPALTPQPIPEAPNPPAAAAPTTSASPAGVTAPAAPRTAAPAPVATPKPAAPKKPKGVRKKSKPVAKAVAKSQDVPAAPVAEAGKSALKLESLNLPAGQTDGLAATPLTLPSAQELLQAKQIEALQDELKNLRDLTAKTNATLVDMQAQLQQAQSQRVSQQLFYVVLALLLLSVAVLVWLLWQRYREQQSHEAGPSILVDMPSTHLSPDSVASVPTAPDAPKAAVAPAPSPAADKAPTPPVRSRVEPGAPRVMSAGADKPQPVPASQPAVHPSLQALNHAFTNTRLQDVDDSNFGVTTHEEVDLDIDMSSWAGLGEAAKPDDQPPGESVLDVRQQAEFFVSLGQTERALVVLKKHIAQSARPSPLIFLDLLSLFHSLGYKSDFRDYRAAFNRHFNCVLPDFPAYHLEGLGLLDYPDELARVAQVWNRAEVINYLDACIYRSEQASAQPTFELAAFRDLLMLQAIAEQELGAAS